MTQQTFALHLKGMSGYQALIKYYVGMGLRRDLEALWLQEVPERIQGILDKHGLSEDVRNELLEELLGVVPNQRFGTTEETHQVATP